MVEDEYEPKTIRNYTQIIKMIVAASAKDTGTRKQIFPVCWDQEILLLPAVKRQRNPAFTSDQVSKIIERATGQYKIMFTVLAASGLRISELLGPKVENVLDDRYRLRIVEKNYNGVKEDRLKTNSAERIVELHSSVAMLLRSIIGKRTNGWVFETKKHKPHSASNILKRYLHPILLGDHNARSDACEGWRARFPSLPQRLFEEDVLPGWFAQIRDGAFTQHRHDGQLRRFARG